MIESNIYKTEIKADPGRYTYTVNKVYSNSANPYFGYLLVTVYDNNIWMGEFKGDKIHNQYMEHTASCYQNARQFQHPVKTCFKIRLDNKLSLALSKISRNMDNF